MTVDGQYAEICDRMVKKVPAALKSYGDSKAYDMIVRVPKYGKAGFVVYPDRALEAVAVLIFAMIALEIHEKNGSLYCRYSNRDGISVGEEQE